MRLLTTAANEAEAEMICARLRAAGVVAIVQGGAFAAQAMALGVRDIYVEDGDLDAARAVLASGEGISEAQLTEIEEMNAAAEAQTRAARKPPAKNGGQPEADTPAPAASWRRRFWRKSSRGDR